MLLADARDIRFDGKSANAVYLGGERIWPPTPWTNHVTVAAPRNGTNTHTIDPASPDNVVGGKAFAPTPGGLLLCIMGGPVTSTTPSGWTLPTDGGVVNNQGLYAWHRTAAGGDTFTTTHNGSNYPVAVDIFEFPAGSTLVKCASAPAVDDGVALPVLDGLTGTNVVLSAATKPGHAELGPGPWSRTWDRGTEITDICDVGLPDGYVFGVVCEEDVTTSSVAYASSTATLVGWASECLTMAIKVPVYDSSSERMFVPEAAPWSIDTGNYTLGIRFIPTVDGRITHLVGWTSGGTHTFTLWDTATATRLASVNTTFDTGPGALREVALPVPVNVVAGTSYTASASSNGGQFAHHPIPASLTEHLTVVGSFYWDGADTFPNAASGNHYFNDVVFQKRIS